MNSVKVGLLTIGQSPRKDVIPEIKPHFLPHIEIVETGILDNLSPEETKCLQPESGESTLVARLRNGTQIFLSEQRISSLLPKVLDFMEKKLEIKAAGILCTHDFPKMKFSYPVIFPFNYLHFLITHVFHVQSLGVVVPLESQIEMAKKKWNKEKTVILAKSPYAKGISWRKIAQSFIRENVEAVILDCIGYKIKDKREIQSSLFAPVLLPRMTLAFAINQLF